MSAKWNFSVDIEEVANQMTIVFGENVNTYFKEIMQSLDSGLKLNGTTNKGSKGLNYDTELKELIEKNKQLKLDMDKKMEEITNNQAQYEKYKQDHNILTQEVKETHEAFLMAKKYYKKYLKMYYTIEKTTEDHQLVFVQFFTESKKEDENYSVRLKRDMKTAHYELIETKPLIKTFEAVQKQLKETNEVPAILSSIRQTFLSLKNKK